MSQYSTAPEAQQRQPNSLHANVSTPLLSPGNDPSLAAELATPAPTRRSVEKKYPVPAPSPCPRRHAQSDLRLLLTRPSHRALTTGGSASHIRVQYLTPRRSHAADTRISKRQHTILSRSATAQISMTRLLRFVIACPACVL
jgi:hypothetical protein